MIASAGSPFQANDILEGLAAGFSQFGSPMRNDFRIIKPRNPKTIINDFIYRNFNDGEKMILSSEEIASIYHLPISSTETPRVKWLKSKESAPPDNLAYKRNPDRGKHVPWADKARVHIPMMIVAAYLYCWPDRYR